LRDFGEFLGVCGSFVEREGFRKEFLEDSQRGRRESLKMEGKIDEANDFRFALEPSEFCGEFRGFRSAENIENSKSLAGSEEMLRNSREACGS
jgi:hypothetical protein